jgi:hypothetical protein
LAQEVDEVSTLGQQLQMQAQSGVESIEDVHVVPTPRGIDSLYHAVVGSVLLAERSASIPQVYAFLRCVHDALASGDDGSATREIVAMLRQLAYTSALGLAEVALDATFALQLRHGRPEVRTLEGRLRGTFSSVLDAFVDAEVDAGQLFSRDEQCTSGYWKQYVLGQTLGNEAILLALASHFGVRFCIYSEVAGKGFKKVVIAETPLLASRLLLRAVICQHDRCTFDAMCTTGAVVMSQEFLSVSEYYRVLLRLFSERNGVRLTFAQFPWSSPADALSLAGVAAAVSSGDDTASLVPGRGCGRSDASSGDCTRAMGFGQGVTAVLQGRGLYELEAPGDGSCQFHSCLAAFLLHGRPAGRSDGVYDHWLNRLRTALNKSDHPATVTRALNAMRDEFRRACVTAFREKEDLLQLPQYTVSSGSAAAEAEEVNVLGYVIPCATYDVR